VIFVRFLEAWSPNSWVSWWCSGGLGSGLLLSSWGGEGWTLDSCGVRGGGSFDLGGVFGVVEGLHINQSEVATRKKTTPTTNNTSSPTPSSSIFYPYPISHALVICQIFAKQNLLLVRRDKFLSLEDNPTSSFINIRHDYSSQRESHHALKGVINLLNIPSVIWQRNSGKLKRQTGVDFLKNHCLVLHGKVYEALWRTTTVAVKELISYENKGNMMTEMKALVQFEWLI
jgi:hypothetical protein